ncbi:MAG: phosphatase PAP2 family protein [Clostridiales bacterium]|nr:phosphatase PAP2 family protein [Clostridiales bacterium]
MEYNKRIIFLNVFLIILFFIVGFMVKGLDTGIFFDVKIMDYIHNNTRDIGISTMKIISHMASAKFIIPITILIFLYMYKNENIKGIKLLFLSTLGSYMLNEILKHIFVRTRPFAYFLVMQGGYSYPSGHSMVAMSFYTSMTYLLTKAIDDKKLHKVLWTVNALIILLIGFSRIYLGVHWPTDVLAGFGVGYCYYNISKILVEKY